NDWIAMTYSFFIMNRGLNAPRWNVNLYSIGLLFLPKSIEIPRNDLAETFERSVESLSNIEDLNDPQIVRHIIEGFEKILKMKATIIRDTKSKIKARKDERKVVREELQVEPPMNPDSMVALPWILHSVYHGLEKASTDILGDASNLLDKLADNYTREILERFHLLDKIGMGSTSAVSQALTLGTEHLSKVGEKVTVTPLSDNRFLIDVECSLANAVHPMIPIAKCLWIKYLSAIVSRVLPPEKEIILQESTVDAVGSRTILEIRPKPFQTVEILH
ncbi:MAG TPA: hypothetical protein VJ044_00320, partial [Candidatus Hodarchaeales archaeon]|nr:hypothetical protein [Candidatus Hodarchaeales archaeon]